MNSNSWINSYKSLNNSFDKKMLFRLGADAGYFSEFNNMVLAIAFCLSRRIKFILYSKSTFYSSEDSWNDFFIPFGPQNDDDLNLEINLRPYQVNSTLNYKFSKIFYKTRNNIDYLTQDLWSEFHNDESGFSKELFTVPELDVYNFTLLEFSQIIIKNIWVYNSASLAENERLKSMVNLPSKYISLHIRSGDKILEKSLHPMHDYMKLIKNLDCNNVFVLTDNYDVIEDLSNSYGDYNFFTLCRSNERGYFHKDFVKLDAEAKYMSHIQLFASVDLCAKSQKFIGTYSSNPGMYMGMRIGEEKCIGVDYNNWLIW
jgi:hypothetical protein